MSRPFRYTFILGLVALATALAAVGGWRYARASAPVNGPIILISVEGLRADRLPVYGYRQARTPAIDTLAADGIVFEHAYAHVPQTLPAHVSMLTGRLPFETGVRDSVGFVVKDEERTLAEMLRDRGFATGGVVSTYALRKETGVDQGFTFFDSEMPAADPDSAVGELWRGGEASERIAEHWLDGAGTSRLFLLLQLSETRPSNGVDSAATVGSAYDGQLGRLDQAVGRLVRYLKAHQLYDRSTIILVADHGEGLGDHGEQGHGLFVYEEALRIPLIIKQAGAEGAGRRVTDLVQHVDLAPTILDLAKAPDSGHLSGRSLTSLLDGGRLDRRMIYSESFYGRYHFGWSELTSITDGRYRYIRAPQEELYDLERDPRQLNNLAAAGSGNVPPVIDILRHELKKFGVGMAMPQPAAISSVEREHLDALGYVGTASAVPESNDVDSDPIDPKDKVLIVETYRSAVQLGIARRWSEAINLLRAALREEPDRADLWKQLAAFATLAGRHDQAAAAYARILALQPNNAEGHLGAAAVLLRLRRLDEARQHAAQVVKPESESSAQEEASAHTLLAEIALARHDAETAREEAVLAREMDSRLPLVDYVEARQLYDQGRLSDALPYFEKTISELETAHGEPMAELHYYAGDAHGRLKEYAEAEREFLEELKSFPQNSRARAALASVYRKTGRLDEAGETISALLRFSPTRETYQLAARLWETFGNPRQAAAVRAEERRLFAPAAQPGIRATQ